MHLAGVDTDPRTVFGMRVRKLRGKQGLSQEALAELAGFHRTYLGGVERGERNPGLLNIVAVARALGVTPSVLLRGVV